jgi:DNA topoisomerase IB
VTTKAEFKRVTNDVVKLTAARLGNRPATCRKYYIHPAVFTAFEKGTLFEIFKKHESDAAGPEDSLTPAERAVMEIIETSPALLTQVMRVKVRSKRDAAGEKRIATKVTVRVTRRTQAAQQ